MGFTSRNSDREGLIQSGCADWLADFSPDEEEKCRNTLCISSFSDEAQAENLPPRRASRLNQCFPMRPKGNRLPRPKGHGGGEQNQSCFAALGRTYGQGPPAVFGTQGVL